LLQVGYMMFEVAADDSDFLEIIHKEIYIFFLAVCQHDL